MAKLQDFNWPIYSLANYDNSGYLLDQCRELLGLNQSQPKKAGTSSSATTVSGYHTLESTRNNNNNNFDLLAKKQQQQPLAPLSWVDLLGNCADGGDLLSAKYAAPVRSLYAKLEAAIR